MTNNGRAFGEAGSTYDCIDPSAIVAKMVIADKLTGTERIAAMECLDVHGYIIPGTNPPAVDEELVDREYKRFIIEQEQESSSSD